MQGSKKNLSVKLFLPRISKPGTRAITLKEKRQGLMIHIETVIYIIAYTILAIFLISLWVDSISDKEREKYLERIAILKGAINKSKKRK